MKVFKYQAHDGCTATYVDRKRPFWAMATLYALFPFTGILLHAWTESELARVFRGLSKSSTDSKT